MKYLFSLLLLVSLGAYAQEPPYTPMRLNYQFRGIRVDSLFLIPNYVDTSVANGSLSKRIAGSFIRTGNDFWMRNSDTSAWLQNVNVGSGASPTLNFVNNVFKKSGTDSVFYVVAPADTFFSFKDLGVDTTSLSNRIDLKVDSLKRSSDSVYFKRSGVWSFGYRDSLGQPVNFANTDLRADGNRYHSFADNSLYIDSITNMTLRSTSIGKYGIYGNTAGEPYILSLDQVDFSMSNALLTKDSAFYGGTKSGSYFGLRTHSDNNNVSLLRGPNIAYLSRKNFGIDTLAMLGDLTSLRKVDTIYRTSGKDSIFFKIGSNTYKIKDSTGVPYSGDSPDRIDGTATGPVTADMDGNIIRFTDAETFKIDVTGSVSFEADSILKLTSRSMIHETKGNKYEFKDFNNTFLRIDTLGNFEAGDLTKDSLVFKLSVSDSNFYILSKAPSTWREKNSGLTSQVKTGYPKSNIDLSTAAYEIKLPGVYSVIDASTNNLILPDPANWGGQSITIINRDGANVITFSGGNDPYIYDGSQINTQWTLSIMTIYSDGQTWTGIYNK